MKRLLGLALCLALFAGQASARSYTDNSNFGAVGVGDPSTSVGTYTVLTGVALASQPLSLNSILQYDGYTAVTGSAITTAMYVAQATGLTNTTAIVWPANTAAIGMSLQTIVPMNYLSGGYLELRVHYGGATNSATVQCTTYQNTPDSATTTAGTVGASTNIPAAAATQLYTVTLGTTATYVPGNIVMWKVLKPLGGNQVLEVVSARFRYKPYGVIN